jgi:hypothetical protein
MLIAFCAQMSAFSLFGSSAPKPISNSVPTGWVARTSVASQPQRHPKGSELAASASVALASPSPSQPAVTR